MFFFFLILLTKWKIQKCVQTLIYICMYMRTFIFISLGIMRSHKQNNNNVQKKKYKAFKYSSRIAY